MDGVITAIEPQRHRGGRRWNVFIDGRYAFSLEPDLAGQLCVGQVLDERVGSELLGKDEQARGFEAALAFLAVRPRSEREVRDRLQRKSVPPTVVEQVLVRLRDQKLLDDREFARYWIEQRQTHRPRGTRLLRQELMSKGIDVDSMRVALEQSQAAEEPSESAYRAARRRAQTLGILDERAFQQRLGQFLLRRGFDYETASSVCRRLWRELQ